MALAAERAISAKQNSFSERVVDFTPENLRAPFVLRVAALAIDYIVVIAIPVVWLILSRMLSDLGTTSFLGPTPWLIALVLFIANSLVLPMLRGRTLGKFLVGLTIVGRDGTRPTALAIIRRNILGYLLTILTFGIGFLIAAVNSSGRALHDMVGGTVVIQGRRRERPQNS